MLVSKRSEKVNDWKKPKNSSIYHLDCIYCCLVLWLIDWLFYLFYVVLFDAMKKGFLIVILVLICCN